MPDNTFLPFSARGLATLVAGFAALVVAAALLSPALHGALDSVPVRAADLAAWNRARALATPALLVAAGVSNALHGTIGILCLTAAAAWLWRRQGRHDAWVRLLMAVPAGMLLNLLVKLIVARDRPSWAVVDLPSSASFPSGHVAEATVFYGALAIETARRESRRLLQGLAVAAATGLVAFVAFSRIVVGVHFLSDCLGALAEAGLWLVLCFQGPPLLRAAAPGTAP